MKKAFKINVPAVRGPFLKLPSPQPEKATDKVKENVLNVDIKGEGGGGYVHRLGGAGSVIIKFLFLSLPSKR